MGEIVRLPVTARTKARQTKAEYGERAKLAQFPDRFIYSGVRAKAEQARALLEIERTPALMVASAIFLTLNDTDRARAKMFTGLSAEGPSGKAACAWLRLLDRGGAGSDLNKAIELVQEGRL